MAGRFQNPNYQFFDENGNPLAGGKLDFFESGTSTRQDTFSDDGLTVANTNPVILDGAGRAGDVFFLNADYKVVLREADDTVVWTADPVRSTTQKSSEVRNVSATTQLGTDDDGKWIAADATAGGFIVTLPPVAEAKNGFEITVQKVDSSSNAVTVDGSGSETINGLFDVTLEKQYELISLRCDGTQWLTALDEGSALPTNYITGLELSNGAVPAADVAVSAGSVRADDDQVDIVLSSAITKKINAAFAEGNNQGGLDTGTVSADSEYDVYAIAKDDATADVLLVLKNNSPSLPSGFTRKAFIGRRVTDGSSSLVSDTFLQQRVDGQYYYGELDASSGTNKDFLGLPDGPDRAEVNLVEVSATGSSVSLDMNIGGDSGFDTTSTYTGQVTNFTNYVAYTTAYRLIQATNPGTTHSGLYLMNKADTQGQVYTMSGSLGYSNGNTLSLSAGSKDLSSQAFSRLRIAWVTGDFDNGKIVVTAFKAGAYTP